MHHSSTTTASSRLLQRVWIALAVLTAVTGLGVSAAAATTPSPPGGDRIADSPDQLELPSPRQLVEISAPDRWTMASVDGVDLALPSARLRLIAFHEATTGAALPLSPHGAPLTNRNVPRYDPPPPSEGLDYAVLGTRHRGTPATSAVDVAVHPEEEVVSPVSGTVTAVDAYTLYGRHPDAIVEIAPAGRPDVRVVAVHLEGVAVEPGDHVEAGSTPLAVRARAFPFTSQIDKLAGPGPHVHLEVRRAD